MGVLTDFFIATDDAIRQLPSDRSPLDLFPGIDFKGILPTELAELYGLLTSQSYDETFIDTFLLMQEASDDGPWIYKLPMPLLDALTGQEAQYLVRDLANWSIMQDVTLDDHDRIEVTPNLLALIQLIRQAAAEQKAVYLWICL
jgi:hypothetical protein